MLLGLACCVMTTACGERWTDEQRDALSARGAGRAVAAGDQATTATTAAPDGSEAPASTQNGSATRVTPEGSGSGGPADIATLPCTAPSTAPGVTADELAIGSISTLSGPVSGLGETGAASMRAYVAYRNATGGVCGRKVVLRFADDGTELGRYRAAVVDLNSKVLGLVGGTAAGDAGGVERAEAFGMPVVTATFSVEMGRASTAFDISPGFEDIHKPIGKYDFMYRQGVRNASIVTVGNALTRAEVAFQRAQMEASGIKIVNFQELPLSTLSFDAPARGVANSGADYLLFIYDPGNSAAMAKSLQGTGYKGLKFAEYVTAYGSKFIEVGGPATEKAVGFVRTAPNEDPNPTPNQALFLKWMSQIEPRYSRDTFAADSWAAATAFFDGLEALPGPISREALLAHLNTLTSFDARGLLGPINLGESFSNGCGVWMQVVNQKWQRLTPAQGFLC